MWPHKRQITAVSAMLPSFVTIYILLNFKIVQSCTGVLGVAGPSEVHHRFSLTPPKVLDPPLIVVLRSGNYPEHLHYVQSI